MSEQKMISITVNGQSIEVADKSNVLEVIQAQGTYMPTLCYLKDLNDVAACRMCVAEVNGSRLQTTCTLEAAEGMVVNTETDRVYDSRKQSLELLASYHSFDCWTCPREKNCDLFDQMRLYNVDDVYKHSFDLAGKDLKLNESASIVLDSSKCVHCSSCIAVCDQIAGVGVLEYMERGYDSVISPIFGKGSLDEVNCIGCGLCAKVCPTAAIVEKDHIQDVQEALRDPNRFVVAQVDPAVRAAIGEDFGYDIGTNVDEVESQILSAIKALGFDDVITTSIAEDIAVFEGAAELMDTLENAPERFPLFSSCSAGWIRYAEQNHPEMLDHISTAKAPHMLQGTLLKSFLAHDAYKINATKLYVVTISPCTAHKSESDRDDMVNDGLRNVDAVLTTREIARMIRKARIDVDSMPAFEWNSPVDRLDQSHGFRSLDGGLMERILRFANRAAGQSTIEFNYTPIDDYPELLESTVTIGNHTLRLAKAHGGKNMQDMMDYLRVQQDQGVTYHYVELMGCPGGCLNGGGQPILREEYRSGLDVVSLRQESILQSKRYDPNPLPTTDQENAYQQLVDQTRSMKAKRYFHTTYQDKSFINK